ncbi:HGL103Cp [Eremothecium sinecaudum]|uniref:Golgi apparatus membrane protein TVP23 n=1 Tax=Eremothecium sinecaudum TaxID=45286 RepID=A0A0X8HVE1_9SACH|nr:HGL103Cp [Eremothecium sinecaudum]AMD22237.1 HGL103Cp [Eremothecium sinecaudum]
MESARTFYKTILKSTDPFALSLHLSGKAVPIVFYILGSWFLSFTAQFIVITLLIALDFYITKNICGRRLVQLRWWYDADSNLETSPFSFESYKQYPQYQGPGVNPIDSRLFWWSCYVTPVVWGIFGLLCLLRFQFIYLLLTILACGLTGYNAYGFHCCDKWDPQAKSSKSGSLTDMLSSNFDGIQKLARFRSLFNL